jgi:hypothetical protein
MSPMAERRAHDGKHPETRQLNQKGNLLDDIRSHVESRPSSASTAPTSSRKRMQEREVLVHTQLL